METPHTTDVVIIGAGLAGAAAAAMLGRQGVPTVLVDPSPTCAPDFRCEKLEASQLARLQRTGLAPEILAVTTPSRSLWIARYGIVVDRRADAQVNARYEVMVNALRATVQGSARLLTGRVTHIAPSSDRQRVTLDDGSTLSARLVVLACGLSPRLLADLGLTRRVLSAAHSISVGFDMRPVGAAFPFRALTWYPRDTAQRIGYLTLFPIDGITRANLFVYREPRDPWLRALREDPVRVLSDALPGLDRVTGPFTVSSRVLVRPADLYTVEGVERPGVVLIGDARATSCPAAGTGTDKVFTDVERLCSTHIPRWLASPGMGADKIATFYADPEKRDCDRWSLSCALNAREAAVAPELRWRLRRRAAFLGQLGIGAVRRLRAAPSAASLASSS